MSDTKELKTVAFTMKVTETFKTQMENYARNIGKSQAAILEVAFLEYVDNTIKKEIEEGYTALFDRLEPYFEKHPELDKLNILFTIRNGFSTKALINICDPTQCDDDNFFDIVDVKIQVAQDKGVFDCYKMASRNVVKTATTMTAINGGIIAAPTVINEGIATGSIG